MPNMHQIQGKFVLNSTKKVHNLQHCRKLMQIRCQERTGTKIQKCLVVYIYKLSFKNIYSIKSIVESGVHCTVYSQGVNSQITMVQ